jgi:hypothetical protein
MSHEPNTDTSKTTTGVGGTGSACSTNQHWQCHGKVKIKPPPPAQPPAQPPSSGGDHGDGGGGDPSGSSSALFYIAMVMIVLIVIYIVVTIGHIQVIDRKNNSRIQ